MSLIANKKANFNYEILEKFEAGIELLGFEVKSLKDKRGKLDGSYIVVRAGEAFLIGMEIPPFQSKNSPASYDPKRNRKLLLTKKEIASLADFESKKGLTIVPLSLYNKQVKNTAKIKIEIAVVKGKKKFDKRESLKKRDSDREIRRTLKNK